MPTPVRSRAIIAIFLSIPLKVYSAIRRLCPTVLPLDLLTFCRIWTTLCSLVVDWCVYVLSVETGTSPELALMLHGVSHVSLVWLTRTFSNTWETQLVSLLVLLVAMARCRGVTEGVLVAIGCFCRPTFALFALPYLCWRLLPHNWPGLLSHALTAILSLIAASLALVAADSVAYGSQWPVLAPLHFLAYNTRGDNLEKHGRHAWYTHCVASLPQLLGPLLVPLLAAPWLLARHKTAYWLLAAVLVPLTALSLFPHQEARFLLPIWPPAVVLAAAVLQRINERCPTLCKALIIAHAICSCFGVAFWGYLHEGGLLTAAARVRDEAGRGGCVAVVTYRTLTMPRFLLQWPRGLSGNEEEHCTLHNLMGTDEARFWDSIDGLANELRHKAGSGEGLGCQMHLVRCYMH